ncbi:Carboxymethylenebutenolidase [Rippkaea orientalis PCC 8801]|uniref:Carboxymethylenebutenolidase n=1 Tax=Rippkaea orientalis (strain PCC 8801 / RF-1) TaxID=41431 RepID=B7JZ72_RIPO1|nr:dienelactone hydrolase family protein [Rippkaea orientalis]ACK67283.1 Carboxymethylenebutenolidase [Rippkaea orientalis PCC 8801]
MAKLLGLIIGTVLLIICSHSLMPMMSQATIAQETANQLWLSHQKDSPIPSPLLAQNPTASVTEESVTYGSLNNKDLVGYLARPSENQESLPALIVIHEWWGLNDNIKAMTRQLAAEGYTALAVDLYRGQGAETPEKARELVTQASSTPKQLEDNLKAAYQYLQQEQKAPKIASIGWCFGGTWSLNTALLFPDQLDATVIYYGGGITTDPDQLKQLQMPILGIFGELDQNPPVETVKRFEQVLNSLNKSAEIYIYEKAEHAFANPSGTRYNAEAAKDAWTKTTAFLEKHLK